MRSTVIAVALCLSAAAAAARCVTQAPAAGTGHAGPDLINTAAAAQNARALPWDDEPPANAPSAVAPRSEEHPAAGPAMILAALALMSGIALRRSSGRMR